MDNFIFHFIGACYTMVALPLLIIISFAYILSWEPMNIGSLEDYLIATLFGTVVSLIVSLLFRVNGYYAGLETLLTSVVSIFIPFMFILPFYKNYGFSYNINISIFATIGTILMLKYNASGKFIIFCLMIPVILCCIVYKNKITLTGLAFIVILFIIIVLECLL